MRPHPATDTAAPAAWLGLTQREIERWSLHRVLAAIDADPLNLPGAAFERECSCEIARRLGRQPTPGYIFMPADIARRDLTAGVAGAGGYLVAGTATQTPGASFATALRGASVGAALGVEFVGPMVGNVSAPAVATPPAASWIPTEGTPATEAQPAFGAAALTPKTAASFFKFSRTLLLAAPPAVFEALVLGELSRGLAAGIDAALIAGSGAAGQPTGIVNTVGVGSVAGAALAFLGVASMIEAVESAGLVDPSRAGFVLGTGVAKLLRQRERAPGSGAIFADGRIDGFRAIATRNAPPATIVFGDWSRCAVAEWGVLEIGADAFSGFKSGTIAARALLTCDAWVKQPGAFSKAENVT
ncbi:MAG: phage major capsid protein [Pseudomonadota bacterium]